MQDVVNITNNVNNVMQSLQILNNYNEQEFAPIFTILQSQQSSDKQGTLDQKMTELEPLKNTLGLARDTLKAQFETVQEKMPSIASLEDFKKSIWNLSIQINTNSNGLKANTNLLTGYINGVNPDNQILIENDKILTQVYMETSKINEKFTQSAYGLGAQQIEQLCQKLIPFTRVISSTEDVIKSTGDKILQVKNQTEQLCNSYGAQVNSQWQGFVNNPQAKMVIILNKE